MLSIWQCNQTFSIWPGSSFLSLSLSSQQKEKGFLSHFFPIPKKKIQTQSFFSLPNKSVNVVCPFTMFLSYVKCYGVITSVGSPHTCIFNVGITVKRYPAFIQHKGQRVFNPIEHNELRGWWLWQDWHRFFFRKYYVTFWIFFGK